jgi:pimeloyl-ACP methyl ester carboxylesterase
MLRHLTGEVLAVDLPPVEVRTIAGRFAQPPELFDITVADWATAVLDAADSRGFDRFVLAGHSLGGLTIAAVAQRAPERVAHLVFVSAAAPPEGACVLDTLPDELAAIAREALDRALHDRSIGAGSVLPEPMLRDMFCNDMDDAQARFVLDHFGNEVVCVIGERVSRAGIPPELPKTFVKLLRDQSLPPALQDQLVANLEASPGGTVDVVEIDAGHDVMISRPEALAGVIGLTTT